jgi:signal transduction histidine kinase
MCWAGTHEREATITMTLRPTTLRARLFLGTSLATAAILLAAGVLLYVSVRASLFAEFDLALKSSAEALAALTEQVGPNVRMEPEVHALLDYTQKRRVPDYFSTWVDGTRLIAASDSLAGQALAHPTPSVGASITMAITLPDGTPGRQTTMSFVPAIEDPPGHITPGTHVATVTVARHTKDLDRKLLRLLGLLTGVIALATLSAAGAMLLVVRHGLRPLGLMATRIQTIGKDNLSERVEVSDAPPELTVVALRLNELLDRLESTMKRERRFTADVAHELRTPLAGIAVLLDVCATRPRTTDEYQRTLDKCQRIVRGMHAMVESLMTIARADAGQLPVSISPVPLAALVRDSWLSFEPAAAAKEIKATFEIDPELIVHTDAEKLRMVMNNLLDNAVGHADVGGFLRVEALHRGATSVELRVSNSGSILNDVQAARVFDRFWQGDPARRNTGVHCGLGLSLCRELITVLSGEISVSSEVGGTFAVRVVLPGADRPTPSEPDDTTQPSDDLAGAPQGV